jgi:hypothetical protein
MLYFPQIGQSIAAVPFEDRILIPTFAGSGERVLVPPAVSQTGQEMISESMRYPYVTPIHAKTI